MATWKIVLMPNFDVSSDSRPAGYKVVATDYAKREDAAAAEQGIAAGGRWVGKVLPAADVDAYLATLRTAGLVAA